MKSVDQYFSIVENRIKNLQKRLEIAQHKSAHAKSTKAYSRHQLECEMLEKKISYLQRLTNLPLYLAIDTLPPEELAKLKGSKNMPENTSKEELIKFFHLEPLAKWVKSPKLVTLAYIKDAFMDDFEAMQTLLELNQRNLDINNQKQKLWGVGLDGSNSYLKCSFDEKALNRREEKIEKAIEEVQENFNMTTLREIYFYMHNTDQKLPYEFILKHCDKVANGKNPEMEKMIKRLKRKKYFGWINKFIPFKRNKDEHNFIASILKYYNDNNAINTLGVSSVNIFDMTDRELREFIKYTRKQASNKREEIAEEREKIADSRKKVLSQIQSCNAIQDNERKRFVELVHSKTNFLPKMFEEQLWNEPSLKDSIMLEACYLEEKMLMQELQEALKGTLSPIEVKQLEATKSVPAVKKLVA